MRPTFLNARVIGAAALAAMLAGATGASAEPPNAVATVGMIGDVAQEVAGECVAVETMMGPGIDPHLYKASASDVRRLAEADAILYNGLYLEGQLGEIFDRLGKRTVTRAVTEESVPEEHRIATGDGYGVDPHVWMDARLWARIAQEIADTLAEVAPDCAKDMQVRAVQYAKSLTALDAWIRASIASIPDERRMLVTAHDAFAYFGRAYGIEVIGIQGVSTESEAGIADIRGVVDLVVNENIPAIFVESTINSRTVDAVIEAAAAEGHPLIKGSELFSDAMGEDGTPEGTYIGMIRANTIAIVEALGGTPAALPPELTDWARRWGVPTG